MHVPLHCPFHCPDNSELPLCDRSTPASPRAMAPSDSGERSTSACGSLVASRRGTCEFAQEERLSCNGQHFDFRWH